MSRWQEAPGTRNGSPGQCVVLQAMQRLSQRDHGGAAQGREGQYPEDDRPFAHTHACLDAWTHRRVHGRLHHPYMPLGRLHPRIHSPSNLPTNSPTQQPTQQPTRQPVRSPQSLPTEEKRGERRRRKESKRVTKEEQRETTLVFLAGREGAQG